MKPEVSCICVTQNRRFFLRRAVLYFWRSMLRFDYETGLGAELVIVDGSTQSNEDLLNEGDTKFFRKSIQYHHFPSGEHSRTGWFHNEAVRLSQGKAIIQWDDDDWHDTMRIVKQWKTLEDATEPALTFSSKFYWYHLLEKKACLSRTWHAGKGTVGALLAYHREAWQNAPFRDVPQGEDNYFWEDQEKIGTLFLDSKDPQFCVYTRHNRNGSPLVNAAYDAAITTETRRLLDQTGDLSFYDELSELLPLDNWNRPLPQVSPYQLRQQPWLRRR